MWKNRLIIDRPLLSNELPRSAFSVQRSAFGVLAFGVRSQIDAGSLPAIGWTVFRSYAPVRRKHRHQQKSLPRNQSIGAHV